MLAQRHEIAREAIWREAAVAGQRRQTDRAIQPFKLGDPGGSAG